MSGYDLRRARPLLFWAVTGEEPFVLPAGRKP
jgi:hypothetical protein